MRLEQPARAKINLTLKVLGRRPDGYHALESLVSFAQASDVVSLDVSAPAGVSAAGAFSGAIEGANLLDKVLSLALAAEPRLRLGAVTLQKNLPVAAGLGGGSADAAALLRLIAQANPTFAPHVDWLGLAQRLGADVPVCLAGVPAFMWGIGERLAALPAAAGVMAPLPAVLVNPRVPLATLGVFKALGASPLPPGAGSEAPALPVVSCPADLFALMRAVGNDLEAPATRLLPVIAQVKRALEAQSGVEIAALSGSGPTCFALFARAEDAAAAAQRISAARPDWWTVATAIEFPCGTAR